MADLVTGVMPEPEAIQEERKRRGRPKGSTSQARLDKLEGEVKDKLDDFIAPPLALASPLAGAYLLTRNEKNARALIGLAKKYPRFRSGLESFVAVSQTGDLAITLVGVGTAFYCEMGKMDAHTMIPGMFGLGDIWDEIYGEEDSQNNGGYSVHTGRRGLARDI